MKEFITAAAEESETDPDGPLEFSIDGVVLRAYRPTPGQMAMTMVSLGKHSDQRTRIAGLIDFFVQVLDEESATYVADRLLSRTNSLPLEQVDEILTWLIEEWSAHPTQSPSGSTRSQSSGGQRSKPTTRRSTSSGLAPVSS